METIASNAIFDKDVVLWIMGGDLKDAKALLCAFLLEAKELSAKLEEDIENQDAFALRIHSERLHEAASAVYSRAISYFANRIGSVAESCDFKNAERMNDGLKLSLKLLEGKLRTDGWL